MSSNAFSTELEPSPRLRRLVLASGIALQLLGQLVISQMSVDPAVRIAASGAWSLLGVLQLRRLIRGYRACRRLRIHADGSAEIADAGGAWRGAKLQPGCVVLERVAWLRLDAGRRQKFAELLVGNSRQSNAWRRLQVIWRHLGSAS